ncbi:MAG: NAD(P)H-hydrate dehydratase [Nitriliruptoraceae bacterium]
MDHAAATRLALLDAAAARAADAAAVDAGDTWAGLMERAAGHLTRAVVRTGGHGYGLRVAVLVGRGDNGGDGWAAARRLRDEHGASARVVALDGIDGEVSESCAANRTAWLARGGYVVTDEVGLHAALEWCDVAVDALLGTGVRGAPRGTAAVATRALLDARARGTPVVACDVPSGVSADDGSAPAGAARADVTVTFGALKRGLLLHPGAEHAGQIVVGDLGARWQPDAGDWWALTAAGARPEAFPVDADKRRRGVVLVVAGAVGTSGAAVLAADAALRGGAGLVSAFVPSAVRGEVTGRVDAGVMVHEASSDPSGALSADAADLLDVPDRDRPGVDVSRFDAVAAGPGIGIGPGARAVVERLLARASRLVLDADGLNLFREDPTRLADHAGILVLTPHVRELARLCGDDPDTVWAERAERVPRLARTLDAVIVAKGPGTMVAAPDGRVWVCPLGSPALGTGGTGDALAGLLAAAVAGAEDVALAVARAVWWHAAAGMCAGRDRADRATARDVLERIPAVLGALAEPDPVGAPAGWPDDPTAGRRGCADVWAGGRVMLGDPR